MYCLANVKFTATYLTGLVLLVCIVQVSAGQSDSEPDVESVNTDAVEEIVVYGNRSLLQLRRDVYRAEENFLDVFSSLTNNDEFTFKCEYVTSTGSRRRHRLCMPKFARKAEQRANDDMMATFELMGALPGGYTFFASTANRKKLKSTEVLMWDEMSTLLLKSPEMQKAFNELISKKRIYDSELKKRCDDQGNYCSK